jgi:putative nucleotidyltransferase with HDIG domain
LTAADNGTIKFDQIRIEHLVPGMELARDVHSDDGMVLASAGIVISRYTIDKFKKWSVPAADIITQVASNPIVDPKVEKFINSYNRSVAVIQQAFQSIRETQEVPLDTFTATADEIAGNIRTAGNIIDRLYDMPAFDDSTFHHSVNVGVIAALITTWLDYPPSVVNAVSLAGLLHDVGKAQIPVSLLNRPDKLPPLDYEHYKKHATYGFELLRNQTDLAQSIMSGIIQHHERTDGSGYPYNLTDDKIHPYAKIIAIADIYDEALTVNCDPSLAYSPYAGLEKVDELKYHLDTEFCLMFTARMLNFLSGNIVALSNGRQGRVVFLNKEQPSRSVVQLTDGTVLDLREHTALRIQHVIR